MGVKSAYHINEARIGRKMTGESSSIDPVWVLRWLERVRGHSGSIPRRNIEWKFLGFFFKDFSESPLDIMQLRVRSHVAERVQVEEGRIVEEMFRNTTVTVVSHLSCSPKS